MKPWMIGVGSILGLGVFVGQLNKPETKKLTPTPPPVPPKPQSGGFYPDGFSIMEKEDVCDPTPKPGVIKFKDYILSKFGGTNLGIIRECGGSLSGHTAGKAWDWGILQGNPKIDEMMKWLFDNNAEVIKDAGITYVIYNRKIWNTRDRVWQNYTGQSPHTDHVHFSFGTPGAMGLTKFYQNMNV
jgi:hypothetical protein